MSDLDKVFKMLVLGFLAVILRRLASPQSAGCTNEELGLLRNAQTFIDKIK